MWKFKTDTDKLNIIVYRNWNNVHPKDNQVDPKMTDSRTLLADRVYGLS